MMIDASQCIHLTAKDTPKTNCKMFTKITFKEETSYEGSSRFQAKSAFRWSVIASHLAFPAKPPDLQKCRKPVKKKLNQPQNRVGAQGYTSVSEQEVF